MASPAIALDDVKQGLNAPNNREALRRFRQGIISETFPREAIQGLTVATLGTVFYSLIPLFKGEIATAGVAQVTTAGTSTTLVKHALFTKDGATQLAVTASDHATYNGGTGTFVTNFATPYTVTADDVYLFAHVEVGGTGATLARGQTSSTTAAIGSGLRPFGTAGTGQTDIPGTPLTLAANSLPFWFAIA